MAQEKMKKTYIGYDLGDGETITDIASLIPEKITEKTEFQSMTMPDCNDPGRAMPTVFAFDNDGNVMFSNQIVESNGDDLQNVNINFKRRPSDLITSCSAISEGEIVDLLRKACEWPDVSEWSAAADKGLLELKETIITFTNAIFNDDSYKERIKSAAVDSDEIVFCVGHPTNWSDLDIAIYELIMKNTILGSGKYAGKSSSIIMEAESRAAFLYSKDAKSQQKLKYGTCVLLVDVGSSTVDITAMSTNSYDRQYHTGNNYLGARSIDFMIRNWYLEELKKDQVKWKLYEKLSDSNPSINNALTLISRKVKEDLYSSNIKSKKIYFADFPPIALKIDDLNNLIETTPVAKVLKEEIDIPDREYADMGNRSWKDLFKDFLLEKKREMEKLGINISRIILTGSASKMPFVSDIIRCVFTDLEKDSLIFDMDPSRTISKGLALVGPANEKSKAFTEALNKLVDDKLNSIIENNIPYLAEHTGKVVEKIIIPIMKKRIQEWKDGKIKTLNEMNDKIKADCSSESLSNLLADNKEYKQTIENWLKEKIGKDIAVELNALCKEFGVNDIGIDDLNIMTVPTAKIDGPPIDPLAFVDVIKKIVAIIVGIISMVSITTIMATIVVVLSFVSEALAASLFIALAGMGPVGWGVLAGVVGITVAALIAGGFDGVKNLFQDRVRNFNLPKIARKALTENSINKSLTDANIAQKIADAFRKKQTKDDIIKEVSANLRGQIQNRAESIKYAIQSK